VQERELLGEKERLPEAGQRERDRVLQNMVSDGMDSDLCNNASNSTEFGQSNSGKRFPLGKLSSGAKETAHLLIG